MPRNISEFRVVIASPLEMSKEREVVFSSLDELNRSLDIQGVSLKVLGWEEYTTPGVGTYPQEVVNDQLLEAYDVLIAIFGMRLGTPTPNSRSGTVEEINRALAQNNNPFGRDRVQVYFLDRVENISSIQMDELRDVMAYREELHKRGVLFKTFRDHNELATEARINIQRSINHYQSQGRSLAAASTETSSKPVIVAPDSRPQSDLEDFGILDLVEMSEVAMNEAMTALDGISTTLNHITGETNLATQEIEALSSSDVPSSKRKESINSFANFLKLQAATLLENSRSARAGFRRYFEAQSSFLKILSESIDSKILEKGKQDTLDAMTEFLINLSGGREGIAGYRKSLEAAPRMTIQFNQARRELIGALDETLAFLNESELSMTNLMEAVRSLPDPESS